MYRQWLWLILLLFIIGDKEMMAIEYIAFKERVSRCTNKARLIVMEQATYLSCEQKWKTGGNDFYYGTDKAQVKGLGLVYFRAVSWLCTSRLLFLSGTRL